MKEATGELSTTVITVVAIAAISTLFIVFLYPQLKASTILNQACSNGPGYAYASKGAAPTSQSAKPQGNDGYNVFCAKDGNNTGSWTCYYNTKNDSQTKECSRARN